MKSRSVKTGLAAIILGLILGVGAIAPAQAQLFGGSDGDAQKRVAEQSLRINQLEGQLRQMNGQLEQMNYQVKQLSDLIQRMQKDYEFRLQDLEGGGAKAKVNAPVRKSEAPVPPAPIGGPTLADAGQGPQGLTSYPQASASAPAIAARPGPGAPPASLGTLSGGDPIGGLVASEGAPMDLGAVRRPGSVAAAPPAIPDDTPPGVRLGPPPGGSAPVAAAPMASNAMPASAPQSAQQQRVAGITRAPPAGDEYEAAFGYMLNGEYALAETSFKSFLADHPTDKRAGSGQYWLGESYFSRKMFREAADAFLTSYQQYPDSQKAPDSLYKLGLSLEGMGERKAACTSFDELMAKYPKASKALRDAAQTEKVKAKC